MLSPKDLQTLLNLLSEESKPFETLATTFHRTFNKTDHFKVGCALYFMLEDSLIRQTSHKLAAFYILHDLYKTDQITNNPFLLVFLDSLQKQTIEPVEKQFLIFLINSSYPKDVCFFLMHAFHFYIHICIWNNIITLLFSVWFFLKMNIISDEQYALKMLIDILYYSFQKDHQKKLFPPLIGILKLQCLVSNFH